MFKYFVVPTPGVHSERELDSALEHSTQISLSCCVIHVLASKSFNLAVNKLRKKKSKGTCMHTKEYILKRYYVLVT